MHSFRNELIGRIYRGFGHGVEVHPGRVEDEVGRDGALLLLVDLDVAVLGSALGFARLHHHLAVGNTTR